MCGRATLVSPAAVIVELLGLDEPLPDYPPRYNLAPGQPVLAMHADRRRNARFATLAKWSSAHCNARAETVFQQPAFKEAARKRRCGMIADGFYEWRDLGTGAKQAFHFQLTDGRPFAFAAIELEDGVAILTRTPEEVVGKIHDRMPLILAGGDLARWLDPEMTHSQLADLWKASPRVALRRHPVGKRVNSVANDDPSCSAPAPEEPTQGRLF